jgi:hypothetical protein
MSTVLNKRIAGMSLIKNGPKTKQQNKQKKLQNVTNQNFSTMNMSGNPNPGSLTGVRNRTRGTLQNLPFESDEYVADINGNTTTGITIFAGNIGVTKSFPYGSTIASSFQRYTMYDVEYYYKNRVSGFATAGQKGKVILAFNYDASDAVVGTVSGLETMWPHVDCAPYENCSLRLDPKYLSNTDAKYIRHAGSLGVPGDIKTYDFGLLAVGVVGTADTSNIGELRVRYKCRLELPVIPGSLSLAPTLHNMLWFADSVGVSYGSNNALTGLQFNSGAVVTNTLNAVVSLSGGTILLPPGNYVVEAQLVAKNVGNQITKLGLQANFDINGGTNGTALGNLSQYDDSGFAAGAATQTISCAPVFVAINSNALGPPSTSIYFNIQVVTANASNTTLYGTVRIYIV